jgi:tetratricopeptide (TPR) repeat protein
MSDCAKIIINIIYKLLLKLLNEGIYIGLQNIFTFEDRFANIKMSDIVAMAKSSSFSLQNIEQIIVPYINIGDLNTAEKILSELLKIVVCKEKLAKLYLILAKVLNQLNKHKQAIEQLNKASVIIQSFTDMKLEFEILLEFAIAYKNMRYLTLAFDYTTKAYNIIERSDNCELEAQILNILGILYLEAGDYNSSKKMLKKALKKLDKSNNASERAFTLENIAQIYFKQNRYSEAFQLTERALYLYKKTTYIVGIVSCLEKLGKISLFLNKSDEAIAYLLEALNIAEIHSISRYLVTLSDQIGDLYYKAGKLTNALTCFQKSLLLCDLFDDKERKWSLLFRIGSIFQIQGRYDEALVIFKQCLAIVEILGKSNELIDILQKIAELKAACGSWEESLTILNDIIATHQQSITPLQYARTVFYIAKGRYYLGLLDKEFKILREYHQIGKLSQYSFLNTFQSIIKGFYFIFSGETELALNTFRPMLEEHKIAEYLGIHIYFTISREYFKQFLAFHYNKTAFDDLTSLIEQIDAWENFCKHQLYCICLPLVYLIREKIAILKMDINEVERLIIQSIITSEELGLPKYKSKAEFELKRVKNEKYNLKNVIGMEKTFYFQRQIAEITELLQNFE